MRSLVLFSFALLTACGHPVQRDEDDTARVREIVLRVIRDNPAVVLETLHAYERERAQAAQRAEEAALRERIAAANLPAQIGTSPLTGEIQGRRLVFVFSDFQCPFCARANEGLRQFGAKHAAEVTLIYKHLPLTDLHPQALPAARAAWAAHRQGRFWDYHDALFAHQQALGDAELKRIAAQLGLDIERFDADRASAAAAAEIERDLALATQLGVGGTPFFVLDGQPLAGALPLEAFEAALRAAQRRTPAATGASFP